MRLHLPRNLHLTVFPRFVVLLAIMLTSTLVRSFAFFTPRSTSSLSTFNFRSASCLPSILSLHSTRLFSTPSPNTITNKSTTTSQQQHPYDHKTIESKWQTHWSTHRTFLTPSRTPTSTKPKKYILDMFPYPSGSGLHVGHPSGYTASDIMARYYRHLGYDVLHPMGWDSFGLPAEQHAINTGVHPRESTEGNIKTFKRQLMGLGFSYDWEREVATTDTGYVKWTQQLFLHLFHANLAFQSSTPVNYCPVLGTVLANEEVISGLSERGSHPVERVKLRQWQLRITEYAERLEEGLEGVDWPEGTVKAQRKWIGKSVGCEVHFDVCVDGGTNDKIEAFTTRPETLAGVTFLCLAPEHPLIPTLTLPLHTSTVEEYVKLSTNKSDIDRLRDQASSSDKSKTGAFTGSYCINPLTCERVPVYVADYVLGGYGSGAVMGVPGHDGRDLEFAAAMGMISVVKVVVRPVYDDESNNDEIDKSIDKPYAAYTGEGTVINSTPYLNGLTSENARAKVTAFLTDNKKGGKKTTYKLRDWVFSRQRYWGEPIPIYFPVEFHSSSSSSSPSNRDPRIDDTNLTIRYDTPLPLPSTSLPLLLPEMSENDYTPGDDPAGCLARAKEWRYFSLPKEGGERGEVEWFARETNTMPQWAGSCWYYLRFMDPHNTTSPFSPSSDHSWGPVDLYVGGAEHAVLHLLYARFWHSVLFDLNLTRHPEPFQKLVHQGMILGADGEKMSKSRGNVVNPDVVVEGSGADALRLYEMFMGPLEAVKPWQAEQVSGVVRFRDRVYNVVRNNVQAQAQGQGKSVIDDEATLRLLQKTIQKVTNDIEAMSFNTAISSLMVLSNHLSTVPAGGVSVDTMKKIVILLSPFAPHLAEELWGVLGGVKSLAYEPWVSYDSPLCVDDEVVIGIQVNGKTKGKMRIGVEASEEEAVGIAMEVERVKGVVGGKVVRKVIYKKGRILNFIVDK